MVQKQRSIFDKPIAHFAKDSDTSFAAAEALTEDRLNRLEAAVYEAILNSGSHGLTREEIEAETGLPGNTVRPRVKTLLERERIYPASFTRKTRSGREAEVLKAT